MPIHTSTLTGHLAPDQEKSYVHLPFDMPAGAARLQVRYHYNQQISSDPTISGGNTLDLGVFDERGIEFLRSGFRGWSGSERAAFEISAEQATPGYLAGPLKPGRWHVLLGLYKIAPDGCDYEVQVTITIGVDTARLVEPAGSITGDLPSSAPAGVFAPWLRGEIHCHTDHSDGIFSPQELIERARRRGLDFLAVTDHNSTAGQQAMEKLQDPGLVLIRGVEVTTFKGHFNVWGIPDFIDFRVMQPEDLRRALRAANECGALTACNHPKPFGPDWDFQEVREYQCVEAWNGPWNGLNELSLQVWVDLLAEGRRIPAVGGSDFHRPGEQAGGVERNLGTPTCWVYVPRPVNASAILEAMRRGHICLSGEPDGPFVDLRGGPDGCVLGGDALEPDSAGHLRVNVTCLRAQGCVLRLLDQRGARVEQVISADEEVVETILPAAESLYLRAELRDDNERVRAMSNPLYIEPAH